jgi:hypothetical protein
MAFAGLRAKERTTGTKKQKRVEETIFRLKERCMYTEDNAMRVRQHLP